MTLEDTRHPSPAGTAEEHSGVGQFEWATVTNSWWWSDAMYRLYGYEPRAIEPTKEIFLHHKDPRDMARIDAVFDRCLSQGGPFTCYHRINDARRKQKTVVVVGYGDRDVEDTRTVLMHGYIVDVTASVEHQTSAQLQAALTNRAGIEQIKGALMVVYGLDADAAFAMLRSHSQVYNTKVSAIAAAVLAALRQRASSERITRGEFDRMLWDAAH